MTWLDIENADEAEIAQMLTSRGSDLSEDGPYSDELAAMLRREYPVLTHYSVLMRYSVLTRAEGDWFRYALHPSHPVLWDAIARSHAAAAAVLLVDLIQHHGGEPPLDLLAMSSRVLAEGGVFRIPD